MNEAVIRLLGSNSESPKGLHWMKGQHWMNRQHFLTVASRAMRRFLVDYARTARARRRRFRRTRYRSIAGRSARRSIAHWTISLPSLPTRRSWSNWYFGGLSLEGAAEVIGISPRMADKDWALAKAWLHRRLGENNRGDLTSAKSETASSAS